MNVARAEEQEGKVDEVFVDTSPMQISVVDFADACRVTR